MAGPYTLSAAVRGFRPPESVVHEVLVDRNMTDIVITLEPQQPLPGSPSAIAAPAPMPAPVVALL
jgi:hypothetical protein